MDEVLDLGEPPITRRRAPTSGRSYRCGNSDVWSESALQRLSLTCYEPGSPKPKRGRRDLLHVCGPRRPKVKEMVENR